nr:unnamed protein product [Spirometra erinaceieuropaei]
MIAASHASIKDANCCVVQNVFACADDQDIACLPTKLSKLLKIKSRLPNHGDSLRESFSKFVSQVLNNINEATEQEELTILNSKNMSY